MDGTMLRHRLMLALVAVTALVASLIVAFLAPRPALADHINESTFQFDFVNGTSLTGSHGPGGEAPIPIEFFEAFYGVGNVPAALVGVTIHVSCSDVFTDEWGNSGFPNETDHPDWRIADYSIVRHTPGTIQECGETFVTTPTEPPTTPTEPPTTPTPTDEVLATSIVPSTEPEVTPTNETLPFTGAENGSAAALALVLAASGVLTLIWAREFRVGRHESPDG